MPKGVYAHKRYGIPGIKGPGPRTTLRRVFERYAAKGPVNIPGAQKSAHQAYEEFKHLLTPEEKSRLSTARGHALDVGEGRGEFDRVCADIRKRLFNA